MNASEFRSCEGFIAGVFDGHGGYQVSNLCMKKLHIYIDEELKKAEDSEESVKAAISRAFARIEEEWTKVAGITFNAGFAEAAYVGACVVVSLVLGNKLYVANLGDCKAVLLSGEDDNLTCKKLTKTHSANS